MTSLSSQSLSAHSADIETDTVMSRSDYLVLTETWMRNSCNPFPVNNYECVSGQNNRSGSDTNAAGGVAIYRKLSSTSAVKVVQVSFSDTTLVIKNTGDVCLAEITFNSIHKSMQFFINISL